MTYTNKFTIFDHLQIIHWTEEVDIYELHLCAAEQGFFD